jgi:hypothetical protein
MWATTDKDSFWIMLKEMLIWSFIIAMIYVNIKFIISGTKSRYKSGKGFVAGIKEELGKMKFRRKAPESSENNENIKSEQEESEDPHE